MHGMRGTDLWWCRKLYIVWKWIVAQLHFIAVACIRTTVPRVTYLQPTELTPHPYSRHDTLHYNTGDAVDKSWNSSVKMTHEAFLVFFSFFPLQFKIVVTWLISCWSFRSWQHLRSYSVRYRLVTLHTYGDYIVLPHWEIRLLAPWPNIPLSHIILTLS